MTTRFTPERLASAWLDLGLATVADDLFEALRSSYAEPHRAYHTAQHIDDCLRHLDMIRARCERPAEIEIALWFHDAIYDPMSGDNELRSADWAARELERSFATEDTIASIRSLILITRHDAVSTAPAEQVLSDIDLSILGAEPERFAEYEAQVRKEYAWVPDAVFRHERARLLRRFLARPAIYATAFFREMLEEQARVNLAESIAQLAADHRA